MERRVIERHNARLPEKVRVTCLLKLVPEKLAFQLGELDELAIEFPDDLG